MKKTIVFLFLGLSGMGSIGQAATNLVERHQYIVQFSDGDAQRLSAALGLQEQVVRRSVVLEVTPWLTLAAKVEGSVSNGIPVYHHSGEIILNAMGQGAHQVHVTDQKIAYHINVPFTAEILYSALKIKPVDLGQDYEAYEKVLETGAVKIRCEHAPQGFIHYQCSVEIKRA